MGRQRKASYTLNFTEEGENIVTVSASSDGGKKKQLTYRILYRRAEPGEEIGRADLECGGVHGRMRLHRRTDGSPDPRRGNGGGTAFAPAVGERLGRLLWGDGKVLVLPCLYRGRHGIGGTLQQLPGGARYLRNRAGWICPRRFRPF